MKTISILGCGWLGLPLAKSLLQKGFLIKGSTTSLEKMPVLKNAGIDAFQIVLLEEEIAGKMDNFLSNSEILIIDIPPKLRGNVSENFVQKIKNLIPFIEKSTVTKVLFISSTAVYSDNFSIDLIAEETLPNPETKNGKQLLEAEKWLQKNPNFKTTSIRFGGLIGEDRQPIKFLAGKENLENPEAPINLIHQADCIGIITEILRKNCFGETFNAVTPFHPTRKTYYQQKAQELKLSIPKFDETKPSVGKIISSEKIKTVLEYTFQKPEM